jgi:hypothetical protein
MKQGNKLLAKTSWQFDSLDDVKQFWQEVRNVPLRAEGRQHYHEEQYAVGLYMLLLGQQRVLNYPLRLDQAESPDFIITSLSGMTTGLEITRATTGSIQRVMTEIDREFSRRTKQAEIDGTEPEPVAAIHNPAGWTEDQCVSRWCDQVVTAVRRKLEKLPNFRQAPHHDLLICNDADVPLFPGNERARAFSIVTSALEDLQAEFMYHFRIVSVIMSLDLEFDIAGSRRSLVYSENEAS